MIIWLRWYRTYEHVPKKSPSFNMSKTHILRQRNHAFFKSDLILKVENGFFFLILIFLTYTLLNVYVDLLVFTRIAGYHRPDVVDIGVNTI